MKNKENGKILLSKQHRGNTNEGQINLTKSFFENDIFLINTYTNRQNSFSDMAHEVIKRLQQHSVEVPKKYLDD